MGLHLLLTMKCGGEIRKYLMSIYCYSGRNLEKVNDIKVIMEQCFSRLKHRRANTFLLLNIKSYD